jgi:hypothetical protein
LFAGVIVLTELLLAIAVTALVSFAVAVFGGSSCRACPLLEDEEEEEEEEEEEPSHRVRFT